MAATHQNGHPKAILRKCGCCSGGDDRRAAPKIAGRGRQRFVTSARKDTHDRVHTSRLSRTRPYGAMGSRI